MTKYLVLAAVLGTGGIIGVQLRGRGSQEPHAQAQVTELERRVHELERARESDAASLRVVLTNVASLATISGRAAGEAAASDVRASRETLPRPSSEEQAALADRPGGDARDRSPEAQQARREAFLAGLDQAIEAPPADPAWGLPALREAESAVASTLAGARIIDKRCGGDLCRIVVEHGSGEDPSAGDVELIQLPPFNRGSTITHTPSTGRAPAQSRMYLRHPAPAARGA